MTRMARASAQPSSAAPPAVDAQSERILDRAALLFARDGYRNTDLQDVADALGIGKGSLYRRFPTKRDLFLAAVDRGMERMRAEVASAAEVPADALDQVRAAVRAYLEFFAAHPHYVELLIQERAEFRDRATPSYFSHRESSIERWRGVYRELMRQGRVRAMPAERITDVLSQLLYGTMFINFFTGRRPVPAKQAEDLLDVVFHGILPQPAPTARPRPARGPRPAARRRSS
jgi:AcrR family transcriptional regulator